MTCEQFEAIVHDLNRPGAVDEATQTLAQFHTQTCESCQARLAQARSLDAGLRALEVSEMEDGAPPRLEAMLHSAFLRHQWKMARAKSLRRWTAVGIAAALLVTAGLAARHAWRSPAPADVAHNKPAAAIASPQVSAPADVLATAGAQSEDELPADFQPYPAGESILPFESAQIVRVSLPGSALVAMGFPVEGDRAGDSFTADVLVGEDGRPRAIRFPR